MTRPIDRLGAGTLLVCDGCHTKVVRLPHRSRSRHPATSTDQGVTKCVGVT
jgi:hypothetical protein